MSARPKLPANPPFCVGPFTVQKETLWINGVDAFGGTCHMLDMRGWGYLTGQGQALALSAGDAVAAQAATAQWVVDALNAAWNRRADLAPASADYVRGLEAAVKAARHSFVECNGYSTASIMVEGLDRALSARPDQPAADTRVVTVAQLERWIAYTSEHGGAANCMKEIRAIVGEAGQ